MTKQTSDALEILRNRYYTTPEHQRDLQKAFIHDRFIRLLQFLGRFLQRFKC